MFHKTKATDMSATLYCTHPNNARKRTVLGTQAGYWVVRQYWANTISLSTSSHLSTFLILLHTTSLFYWIPCMH